jgi:hypothetical protein
MLNVRAMPVDEISRTDLAIYLGIYASIVSTAAGLWALFTGVFRDRARISLEAYEAYLVKTTKGPMIVKGYDTLETMGVQPTQRSEIFAIVVRNRGRRPARIETVSQMHGAKSFVFGDLAGQVPFDLPAETSRTVVLGGEGGYRHGEIRPHRFYAVDGAQRIHPLRNRYRQRISYGLYRWAIRRYFERKRRNARG